MIECGAGLSDLRTESVRARARAEACVFAREQGDVRTLFSKGGALLLGGQFTCPTERRWRRAEMAKYKFTGGLQAADTWRAAVNAPVTRYRLGNTY